MGSRPVTVAVIFAGGTGSRMNGATRPKQFLELGGRPIIAHTLQHFEEHEQVAAIFIACLEPWIAYLEGIVERFGFEKVAGIVAGGETCQLSIANGLEAAAAWTSKRGADDAIVLVHDGVRPLIDHETISRCIASVEARGATATVANAQETVIVSDGDVVSEVMDRNRCLLARAPQGFRLEDLLVAERRAIASGRVDYIDCVSLMAAAGATIHTIPGPPDNIKITTRRDFFAFKGYMDYKEMEQLWESS